MMQETSRPCQTSQHADHLLVLKTLIDCYNNKGKNLYTCFVDFQKAFHSVWRLGLVYKLIKLGASPDLIKLTKNMCDQTSQALKINNGLTRSFSTYRGVRQGCTLSPKLFNLFVNELHQIFDDNCHPALTGNHRFNCLMYADDLIILSESATGLQSCLDKLKEYLVKWDLNLNLKKKKIMRFSKGGKNNNIPFFFNDNIVKQATEYKYLGTIITDTGNFRLNKTNLKRKGIRASYIIIKNVERLSKPSTAINLFEKMLEPILLYNCEISEAYLPKKWDLKKFQANIWEVGKEVNQVTLGFIRQLLGVNKKSTNIAVLAEIGKYPICIKIFGRIIKYWARISTSKNQLLAESYKASMIENINGRQHWLKFVDFLTETVSLGDEPNTNQIHNKKLVKNFKISIRLLFEAWWKTQAIHTGQNKLDFYYAFKRNFRYETYLDYLPKTSQNSCN